MRSNTRARCRGRLISAWATRVDRAESFIFNNDIFWHPTTWICPICKKPYAPLWTPGQKLLIQSQTMAVPRLKTSRTSSSTSYWYSWFEFLFCVTDLWVATLGPSRWQRCTTAWTGTAATNWPRALWFRCAPQWREMVQPSSSPPPACSSPSSRASLSTPARSSSSCTAQSDCPLHPSRQLDKLIRPVLL